MNLQETLALVRKAQGQPNDQIAKSITTATGLVAYDLQAPAKNLYPVLTPIRNKLPRKSGGKGLATNWRVVQAILGSSNDAQGWVPEGQRSARMSYTTANKAASFVTFGEEDQLSFEAREAGEGFEDLRASMVLRLLQKTMLKEEAALIGGNASLALGTTPTPTLAAAGSGATLPAATYSVICAALTYEGWANFKNTPIATGLTPTRTVTGADGLTFELSGGVAQKSAAATQAVTLGQTLSCSVAAVRGAFAYAWYIGTAGAEKLEKITVINSTTFAAALAGTGQAASALPVADHSRNSSLAFDGLLTTAAVAGNNAYWKSLATGTAGTGTVLTASGRGSVVEIDEMLKKMWDDFQVGVSVLFVNAQELKNITAKVLSTGSGPLLNYFADPKQGALAISAGGVIEYYFNPFHAGGGVKIPIMIHPTLPPGTIMGWADDLPAQYMSNNVPNVAEVLTRQDYYQIDWPLRTRAQEVGVYASEVLAVYAPFATGVITNIADG